MPNHIVVAMEGADDFSPAPVCALDCAAGIAARAGAEVSMVHVEPLSSALDLESFTPYRLEGVLEASARDRRRRVARTEEALHALQVSLQDRWSVHADADVASGPDPVTTERLARGRKGDLLVSRYGDEPCRSGYLGALPERVVRDLEIPVLFLRAGTCRLLEHLDCVLVLLDGSAYAERMLPLAVRLLPPSGGRVHLLVVLPARASTARVRDRSPRLTTRETAEAYLDSVADRPELEAVDVDWTVVVGADATDAIRSVAEGARASLVATMLGGRSPLGLGARRMVTELAFPLLLWRSRG